MNIGALTENIQNEMLITIIYLLWRGMKYLFRGARGVIVIVVGNEHGDTSSNPGRDWLHFT